MTTPTRALVAVLPLLASLACGGRVDLIGPTPHGDAGPPPVEGGPPPPYEAGPPDSGTCPASGVDDGAACSDPGETCSTYYSQCGGAPSAFPCTCTGGAWSCEIAVSGGCPGPACPAPSTIVMGGACALPPSISCSNDVAQYDCSGNFTGYEPCNCSNGAWSCNFDDAICDAGPPPPGNCPDPTLVAQGVACFTLLQQCAGNPTQCDGATFYDDFECDGGAWNDIAPTVCEGPDAGSGSDGSASSSGGG